MATPDPATAPAVRDVSDTAYWIAHLRAMESERPDALFRDPFAARLAGDRGRDIAESMPHSAMVAWTVALRTHIIDDYLRMAIAEGVDTVLDLGAGLDTRPYRLDLPASLRWIEVDYPHVIEYKSRLLAEEKPTCRLERASLDLSDRAARRPLFQQASAHAKRLLILTEGVVPYLTVDEAGLLADDLREAEAGFWIIDYFNPGVASQHRRIGVEWARNAPMRFVPRDWFGFFAQHRWKARDVRYYVGEGNKVGRPVPLSRPLRTLLRILGLFGRANASNFAGYVLLVPADASFR